MFYIHYSADLRRLAVKAHTSYARAESRYFGMGTRTRIIYLFLLTIITFDRTCQIISKVQLIIVS